MTAPMHLPGRLTEHFASLARAARTDGSRRFFTQAVGAGRVDAVAVHTLTDNDHTIVSALLTAQAVAADALGMAGAASDLRTVGGWVDAVRQENPPANLTIIEGMKP